MTGTRKRNYIPRHYALPISSVVGNAFCERYRQSGTKIGIYPQATLSRHVPIYHAYSVPYWVPTGTCCCTAPDWSRHRSSVAAGLSPFHFAATSIKRAASSNKNRCAPCCAPSSPSSISMVTAKRDLRCIYGRSQYRSASIQHVPTARNPIDSHWQNSLSISRSPCRGRPR